MIKQTMMGLALAAILVCAAPGTIAAHEGHTHKVMGTVTSVQGKTVEVKTTDGKSVKVTLRRQDNRDPRQRESRHRSR